MAYYGAPGGAPPPGPGWDPYARDPVAFPGGANGGYYGSPAPPPYQNFQGHANHHDDGADGHFAPGFYAPEPPPNSAPRPVKKEKKPALEKRFACPECGVRFSRKHNMQAHLLTHTGEKLHGCGVCGVRSYGPGTFLGSF